MAYIYLNMNPIKRNTNDCVVRALSLVMGKSWEDVYLELAYEGLSLYDTMEANSTWGNYLKKNGFIQSVLPNTCPLCYTLRDFCKDNPYGSYIVATGSHVIAVIDSDYYDTTDSGTEIVTYFFYKEDR
jgi:hypothetical protein